MRSKVIGSFIFLLKILIIFIALACFVHASEAKQPSPVEIKGAIINALQREVPVSWVGNLMGGRLKNLEELKVVRLGIYNKEKKYWPMKVRCIGIAALNDTFNQGKQAYFDKVADFILYQDDYGDWTAEMRGGMFQ
jgi:hypothetical protein